MSKFLIRLDVGHRFTQIAQPAGEREPPRPTHRWTVFVRGVNGAPIEKFIEKVTFQLHEDFPNRWRAISEPPFETTECGYAGFVVPIYITLKYIKKELQVEHDMILTYVESLEISQVVTLELKDPKNEKLRLALSQCGIEPIAPVMTIKPKKLSPPASVESDPFKKLFGETIQVAPDKEKRKHDQMSPVGHSLELETKPVQKKLKTNKSESTGASIPRTGSSQSTKQTSPHSHKSAEPTEVVGLKVKKKIKVEKGEHESRSASSASHSSHASAHGKSERQMSPFAVKMSPAKLEKPNHRSVESKSHHSSHSVKKETPKLPAGKTPPTILPTVHVTDMTVSHSTADITYDPNLFSSRSPDPFDSDASGSDSWKPTPEADAQHKHHAKKPKKSRKHLKSEGETADLHTSTATTTALVAVKEEKSASPNFTPPHVVGGKRIVADSGVESDSSSCKQHLSPNQTVSGGDLSKAKKSPITTANPKHQKVSNGVDLQTVKVNGRQTTSNGVANDSPSKQPFDKDFLQKLLQLQRKIMCLKEKSVAQKVADIVAASGHYDLSQCSLDFDLCALDKETVAKLFDCLNTTV